MEKPGLYLTSSSTALFGSSARARSVSWVRVALVCALVAVLAPMLMAQASSIPTSTNLSAFKNGNAYDLNATVLGAGAAAPQGTVEFVDVTSGNSSLGTVFLAPLEGTYHTLVSGLPNPAGTLVSGDFDVDGITDLAAFHLREKTITILRGSASGVFQTVTTFPIPVVQNTNGSNFPAYSAIAADFNGDHKLDLAMAAYNSDAIVVFLGNGDCTFSAGLSYLVELPPRRGSYPITLTAADFDLDHKMDIAVATGYGDLYIMQGGGDGTFRTTQYYNLQGGNWPSSIVAADFNNDGAPDIAVTNSYNSNLNVFVNNGNGTFRAPNVTYFSGSALSIGVADFDGDENVDLAIGSYGANRVFMLRGVGDGTFTQAPYLSVGQWPLVKVDDINMDGKPDLVVRTDTAVSGYIRTECVRVFINDGAGNLTSEPYVGLEGTVEVPAIGTFSDRGTRDIAVTTYGDSISKLNLIFRSSAAQAVLSEVFPAGNHDVVANYVPGDGSVYQPSTSNTVTVEGGALTTTTTTLASSRNPATYGDSVTFTAIVTATFGTAAGAVSLMEGDQTLATATLDGTGNAAFTLVLPAGTHMLAAVYVGNESFATSTSAAIAQVVNKGWSGMSLIAPISALPGQEINLRSRVVSEYGQPTGTVEFREGETVLGSGTLAPDGGISSVSITYAFETLGPHTVKAFYSGDANFDACSSGTLTVQVQVKADTTTTLASSVNPSVYGTSTTLTATLTSATGTPTGAVEFFDGGTSLKTATLNASGVATAAISDLTAGTHSITAVYKGDANFLGSTSTVVVQTVTKASSSTAVSSTKSVVHLPASLVLSATVSSTAGTPTGTVAFSLGAASLGTATLDNTGKATLTVQDAAGAGKTTVTASYVGDNNFSGSASTALSQYVFANRPNYQLVADPTNITLRRGATAQVRITLTPVDGFDGTVSLGCTGLATGMNCQFTPAQLAGNLDGTPVMATLVITTMGPATSASNHPQRRPTTILAFWTVGLCGLMLTARGSGEKRSKRGWFVIVAVMALCVASLLLMSACGSDEPSNWTPPGTHTAVVNVAASTSSDGVQAVTPNQQLQLAITVLK